MKKIKEKFTIIERLIFVLALIIIVIVIIPIINDKIEKPKIDEAQENAIKYVEILNKELENIKNSDEDKYNKIIKYNSFSKCCSITDEENQILTCGEIEMKLSSKDIIAGLDSIVYFSNEGVVAGYKLITNGYRVTYPNSKEKTTIRKYKPKQQEELTQVK